MTSNECGVVYTPAFLGERAIKSLQILPYIFVIYYVINHFYFALVGFMSSGKFMQDTCFCTVSTKALYEVI